MIKDVEENLLAPVFKVTAISAAQVIVFVLLYEATVEIYVSNAGPMKSDLGFGITLQLGGYLFSILAGIQSLTYLLLERSEHAAVATVLCIGIWIVYWGNVADVYPNRFALLTVLGVISLFVGVVLSTRPRGRGFV